MTSPLFAHLIKDIQSHIPCYFSIFTSTCFVTPSSWHTSFATSRPCTKTLAHRSHTASAPSYLDPAVESHTTNLNPGINTTSPHMRHSYSCDALSTWGTYAHVAFLHMWLTQHM